MTTNYAQLDIERHNGQDIEKVPVVTKQGFPAQYFKNFFRAPFGANDGRWYFNVDELQFYSGLTGALSKSGQRETDKKGLIDARVRMASEGRSADEEWGERADYGSLVHLMIALHERGEIQFNFGGGDWEDVLNDHIQRGGYFKERRKWEEDMLNDMAMWFNFKKDYDVEVLATEIMVYKPEWRIATPLDIVCRMNFNRQRINANINLKTGDKQFGESYYLQVAMEAYMYNELMQDEDYKLQGTFCLRPKQRSTSPGKYELSKNCIDVFPTRKFEFIGENVVLNEYYKPTGKVKTFIGTEDSFEMRVLDAYQWLAEFSNKKEEVPY